MRFDVRLGTMVGAVLGRDGGCGSGPARATPLFGAS
jgi:hypothetical protein